MKLQQTQKNSGGREVVLKRGKKAQKKNETVTVGETEQNDRE